MIEKIYDATDEQLHEAIVFVEEELEARGASMKASMTITVALEEMFVNIAHYAYPDTQGKLTLGIDFDGDDVIIHLIDEGIAFDPLAKEDPDITLSAEERQIGGLGIYMVKKSMDLCCYERLDGKNHFSMRKRIK